MRELQFEYFHTDENFRNKAVLHNMSVNMMRSCKQNIYFDKGATTTRQNMLQFFNTSILFGL